IVHSNVDDARAYMYSKVGNERSTSDSYVHRFDVVDLDPYGTAAPFLDAAIQCLSDGGLLCVTCTDAGVFASNGYPEKAYALYGGIPSKAPWSHEAGLRLILNSIAMNAAKYGIAVEPLLSLSIDFYARVFVRVHKSPQDVKMLAGTSMMVYNCDAGCGAWSTQPVARNQAKEDKKGGIFYKHGFAQGPSASSHCDHCGSRTHLAGPMWAGPLHNPYFVQRMIDRIPSLDTKKISPSPAPTLKPTPRLLCPTKHQPIRGSFPCPVSVTLDFAPADKPLCPAFALRLVRGVRNGPSPEWLQARLRAIGLRPINTLVDITNFMTFDRNRPLHVFDAAKVAGNLVVRRAKAGETILALDGKTYALTEEQVVIADDHGVESLAGIMGGEASGCDENTVDVLVESALWNPLNIARSGRALGINSDARYRFERGVDPDFCRPGLDLAT
ncbi:MAG: RNA methyltransferase tRNA(m5U54)methyltransferase, partial [Watsoniomyces obsoletus]